LSCSCLEIDLASSRFPDPNRDVPGRGKRSRSFWVAHGSLDIQHKVPLRHSVHLLITDICRQRRQKPRVTNSWPSAKSSSAGIWKSSVLPNQSIYIRRGLLRFKSLCRATLSLYHDISMTPDRENHPLVFGWGIELFIFGINS
jgi:hypothetical protein